MVFVPHTQSTEHRHFAQMLMEETFPPEECPTFSLIANRGSKYHMCVIEKNGTMVGIFAYWNFDTFLYIEHFAISNKLRNNGVGGEALSLFLQKTGSNHQIVLEVELPNNPLAARRIEFYKRHGFVENAFQYLQPPYRTGDGFLPMAIMSRQPLQKEEFHKVKQTLYTEVYGLQTA